VSSETSSPVPYPRIFPRFLLFKLIGLLKLPASTSPSGCCMAKAEESLHRLAHGRRREYRRRLE